ncbi:hypothetical protein N7541_002782 [Penicillium brevicompactum]|uniref:Uncharacterized protein n=1 Tax=Penicillium brevicompactum TaxID=5074 RepID=A0A9W9RKI8_PENBR|nr:hypothetical protein N7541_002782 [Penicillium brevicompactum]
MKADHLRKNNPSTSTITQQGCGKEADQGWGPFPVPRGFPDKPTVTLEMGVLESHTKLQQDAEWWLHPAKDNANITLSMKVDRRRPRIMIDWWERIDGVVQSTQQTEISKADGYQRSMDESNRPMIL